MKTAVIILSLLVVMLAAFLFIKTKNATALKKEANELKARIKQRDLEIQERDRAIELTRDTLEAVYQVFETQRRATVKAERERKEIQKRYEALKFVVHETDSARMNELKRLYPSLSNQ